MKYHCDSSSAFVLALFSFSYACVLRVMGPPVSVAPWNQHGGKVADDLSKAEGGVDHVP